MVDNNVGGSLTLSPPPTSGRAARRRAARDVRNDARVVARQAVSKPTRPTGFPSPRAAATTGARVPWPADRAAPPAPQTPRLPCRPVDPHRQHYGCTSAASVGPWRGHRTDDGPRSKPAPGPLAMGDRTSLGARVASAATKDRPQWPDLLARQRRRIWADSAPTGVTSGRTGVRAKAAIPLRPRNKHHRPKHAFIGAPADRRERGVRSSSR